MGNLKLKQKGQKEKILYDMIVTKTKTMVKMSSFKTVLDAQRHEGLPEVSTISHEIVVKRKEWLASATPFHKIVWLCWNGLG